MKKVVLIALYLILSSSLFSQESDLVFRSNTISEIRITIAQDKLDWVYSNTDSDSLHMASFRFINENLDEQIDSIGFRLRGNTSRDAAKKSFKLDLNEFVKGQDLCGIEKLNLKAEQNDPSLIRSKIAFELMEKIGLPASRVAYTKVYINDEYMGLYEIIEHIDENFAAYRFGNNNGNLWKCLWPADLNYYEPNPQFHPEATWDPDRPYELKTNEDINDQSQLARLIKILNFTPSLDSIEAVIDIIDVIKYFSVNIMTGSWDAYRYLRNNYYLYFDEDLDKLRLIPYDYDNTFGIDWVESGTWGDPNWARIDMYSYIRNDGSGRPLEDVIFNNNEYRNLFTHFMDFYSNRVFREDQWRAYGDSIKALIRPHLVQDSYYPLDHGFNMDIFDNSYDNDLRFGHVERGLYEFMRKRRESTNDQINWQTSPAFIYHQELKQTGRDVKVHASVFHYNVLRNVLLKTFNNDLSLVQTYSMIENPVPGTTLVEEFDRWTKELTLASDETHYQIIAYDAGGTYNTWPRHGYAEFENENNSDLPLFINEFMASNDAAIADPAGEYDDWVEIYNASQNAIDLSGMFLSDDPGNPDKWDFPSGTNIDAGGFLIVWCDEDGDKPQAGLHANFKLSAGGEFISLIDADTISVIDHILFGPQSADISYARISDGADEWAMTDSPTPGSSNIITGIFTDLIPVTTTLYPNYPNPFNPSTAIHYRLSENCDVDLSIYDITGRKIAELFKGNQNAGIYRLNWYPANQASGVYLAVLKADGDLIETQKMLFIK